MDQGRTLIRVVDLTIRPQERYQRMHPSGREGDMPDRIDVARGFPDENSITIWVVGNVRG